VQAGEERDTAANGHCADLKIVEIPVDVQWEVEHHDNIELVREVHR